MKTSAFSGIDWLHGKPMITRMLGPLPPTNATAFPSGRWPGLLLVLSVTLMAATLSTNAHLIEHLGEPDHGDCEICFLSAGLEQTGAASFPSQTHAGPPVRAPDACIHFFHPPTLTAFRSRAPPKTSDV